MRFVIAVLLLLTLYLQYGLRYTRGGTADVEKLQASVAEQKEEIARLKERNRSLSAEVIDLKQGLDAIEERARSEMGMVKKGEVFFRITDPNHVHDKPLSVAGGAAGSEALEPPLDPVAPGDGAADDGDGEDVLPDGAQPAAASKSGTTAVRSDSAGKPAAGVSSKAASGKSLAKPGGSSTATATATGKPAAPAASNKAVVRPHATKPAPVSPAVTHKPPAFE